MSGSCYQYTHFLTFTVPYNRLIQKTPVAIRILAVSWKKPPQVPFLNIIQLSLSGLNGEVSDQTGCPSEGKVSNEDQGNPALTFQRACSQYLWMHFYVFLRPRASGTGQNWVKALRKTFLHWAANLHLFPNSNCTPRSSPKACAIRTTAQRSPDDTVQKQKKAFKLSNMMAFNPPLSWVLWLQAPLLTLRRAL